ncbi:MAG: nitrous oxide reductase accessory protein NosL [Balneolales bacterium]|nr:nitrous oxide reductase accessory protein NosL [Balneolales bacterium]
MVTKKGKVYKYDSIECLIKDTASKDSNSVALFVVADFANPGSLIDAGEAMYLVSDRIPSPMGANLSAFSSLEQLDALKQEKGGTSYTWEEIRQEILGKGN